MSVQFNCDEFIKKLSFPRLPGSEGEIKAQELTESELKHLNVNQFNTELFTYTTFFVNSLLRTHSFLIGPQMIIIIILLYLNLVYYVILLASVLFITALFSREIRKKIQFKFTKVGKKRISTNYIIKLPAKHEDKEQNQNIIILAHYDSISMTFHPIFDGVIFFFSLIGGVLFSLHIFFC